MEKHSCQQQEIMATQEIHLVLPLPDKSRSTGRGANDSCQQWATLAARVVPNMSTYGIHLCVNAKRS